MSAKSDYLEAEILKWATGQTNALGTAATPHIALYTTAPNDASTGASPSPGVEVTGGSYARVAATGSFPAPTAGTGTVANNATISFPAATANWGTVVAFAITSASTGGQILYHNTLTANQTVNNGDTARFTSGTLTITEA